MITTEILDKLVEFQHEADLAEFKRIFGHLGEHFWKKFVSHDFDLIQFYRYLDNHQAAILIHAINGGN